MCGRFTLTTPAKQLATLFDHLDDFEIPSQQPRTNICPTEDVLAVRRDADQNEAVMLRWGLVPSWAKDIKIGSRMTNARAETIFEKPSFRSAIKSKRCVIVTDGFYEWKAIAGRKKKKPFLIARKDKAPWLMAGLWESWQDKQSPDSPPIETCTIITTQANELLSDLHHRMPVKLEADAMSFWLDHEFRDQQRLAAIMQPHPWEGFEISEQHALSDDNETTRVQKELF